MFSRFKNDIQKYYHYIMYCAKSELKTEVANSYLNWLWWVLEPVCFMLIYSFIFGVFFHSKVDHFSAFIFVGITMWTFFANTTQSCVKLIKANKSVVTKVYIPKYVLILIKVVVNAVKMGIGFIIIIGMMIFERINPTPLILWSIPIIITLFFITFGVAAFLMHFGVYVEDLANIWRIVTRMIFYMTGIFYDLESKAGEHLGDLLLRANPLATVITAMRSVLLYQEAPHYKVLALWLLIFIVISVLGIRLIYKNENNYVKSV
ncbi:Teichoic acid translocation permease protein TagG [Lachnospiraceae bacterium TWA4]|nr:Teichoic acid translocation permease protein TagG [Lachnospiraceae bacterium TWA4]